METFKLSSEYKSKCLDTVEDVAEINRELEENKETLKNVILSECSISPVAAESLAKQLTKLRKLESLDISDIFTGRLLNEIPKAISYLLKAVENLPNLHTINLSDNAFGLNVVEPLEEFFSNHLPLKHIYLQNNGLGPTAGNRIARALMVLAEKIVNPNEGLETIVCGRNRLEDGSMASWANAISLHPSLKTIKMVQNGIGPKGIQILIDKGISHCENLVSLDLQDNTFTKKGSEALVRALPKFEQLKELIVSDCLLSKKGCIKLAKALQELENSSLEVLQLQYNEMNSEGLEILYSAIISKLSNLNILELDGNCFSSSHSIVDSISSWFEEHGRDGIGKLDDMESEDDNSTDEDDEEDDEEEEEKDLDNDHADVDNLANLISKQHIN